jgi:A/G-specific adenine glycosylase
LEIFSASLQNSNTDPLGNYFAIRLIGWYQQHHRTLPWRETKDPYKIWLSEIILQQTRVAQGLPYYQRFVESYPTVYDLAAANEIAVLRMWQGLGYYTRARNLHACARTIVEQFQGKFPDNYKALLSLPGVGIYTAAAIASIAFKESVPVVDGNVYRVLARVFGIETAITSTKGKHIFNQLAQKLIPKIAPDIYNQAIMEFGAMQCTPLKPLCTTCIFKMDCIAFRTNKQNQLPTKEPKAKTKQRFFHYLCIQSEDQLLMKKRKLGDIWTGLYDFYLVEENEHRGFEQLDDELVQLIKKHQLYIKKIPTVYKHILTHRVLYVLFFKIIGTKEFMTDAKILLKDNSVDMFSIDVIKSLPKPKLICNFLEENLYI